MFSVSIFIGKSKSFYECDSGEKCVMVSIDIVVRNV